MDRERERGKRGEKKYCKKKNPEVSPDIPQRERAMGRKLGEFTSLTNR